MSDIGDIGGKQAPDAADLAAKKELIELQFEFLKNVGLTNDALRIQAELSADISAIESDIEEQRKALAQAIRNKSQAEIDAAEQTLKNLVKQEQQLTAVENATTAVKDATEDFVTALTGITQEPQTLLGKLSKASSELGDNQTLASKAQEMFTKTVGSFLQPARIAFSLADKLQESIMAVAAANFEAAIAQDQLITGFNTATGFAGKYDAELQGLTTTLLSVGVAQEEVLEAFSSVMNVVRDFTDLTGEQRATVSQTVSLLDQMGFSADAQADNILFLSKSMQLTIPEAAKFNTRLQSLSQSLDIPIGQLTQGFKDAMPVLGASASTAGEVSDQFAKLAAMSKETSLGIAQIVDIAKGFDTFEGAAQKVGLLNSLLGGPFLSTLEMVKETDPAERTRMLISAIQDAGKSFETMSYYEKQVFANAAGLKDVNDLALALSGNMDLVFPKEEDMPIQDIKELKEQMIEYNTVMQSMDNIVKATVVALGPVVDMVTFVAQGIADTVSGIVKLFSIPEMKLLLGSIALIGGLWAIVTFGAAIGTALMAALPYLVGLGGLYVTGMVGNAIDGDDVASGPITRPGRDRTLVLPEGKIRLNNKDTIYAGTQLTAASTRFAMGGATNQAPANNQPIRLETVLNLDGREVAKAVNNYELDPRGNLRKSIAEAVTGGNVLNV